MLSGAAPYIAVGLIVALGFGLRVYDVAGNPAGFFADEASVAYNAYSLAKRGVDEYGVRYPIFFRSFGDHLPPIPRYATIPFVLTFGLNEYAARLASVVVGTATIVLMYLVVVGLLEPYYSRRFAVGTGLVAAFLTAISPWHIHFSRFGAEYIYAPFAVLLALCVFLASLRRVSLLPVAAVAFCLIGYTYLPALVYAPLLTVLTALAFHRFLRAHKGWAAAALVAYVIVWLPTLAAFANGTLLTRWNNVGLGKVASTTERLSLFATQYAEHFSPAFLFTKGDADFPGHFIMRFGVRGQGELYAVDAPFLVIGVAAAILFAPRKRLLLLPLFILLLYPVGSSITSTDGGGPLAFRSILGTAAFPMFTAYGIALVFQRVRSRNVQIALGVLLVAFYTVSLTRYLHRYHREYPLYSQSYYGWQFGPRDIIKRFLAVQRDYDDLVFVGAHNSPQIFMKFYDPENTCRDKCRTVDHGDSRVDVATDRRQLFAIPVEDAGWQSRAEAVAGRPFVVQEVINYPNGQPAYRIGTFQ